MPDTQVTLLDRLCRSAQPEDWSRFIRLYSPLLFSWAGAAGLDNHDAADLVQDVFTILVEQLPGFHYDPAQSFRGWLRTILLNRYRARGRRAVPVTLGTVDVADPAYPTLADDVEDRRQLLHRALKLIQGEFTPATWEMFRRHALVGESAGVVSAAMATTVNAVYIAKSRVLQRLRQEMTGMLD